MNETGITATEACRTRSLTPEDFERMCTEDGNLKEHHHTTLSVKNDSAKSMPVNTDLLYISMTAVLVAVACVVVVLSRRRTKKK